MKMSKEQLRRIIKEELLDLEQEGHGHEVGYNLAYASKKQKMDPAVEKQRNLNFSGANVLSALLNPIVGDGRNTPAADNEIDSAINIATDGKDQSDIAKIFDFIKANVATRADMLKNNPQLKPAFDATVEKLMAAIEKKSGGQEKLEQETMSKVNEIKIKIK